MAKAVEEGAGVRVTHLLTDSGPFSADSAFGRRVAAADKDANGIISVSELRDLLVAEMKAQRTVRNYRTLFLVGAVFSLLIIFATVGLTVAVVQLSKDTRVDSNGVMTVKGSDTPVSTATALQRFSLWEAHKQSPQVLIQLQTITFQRAATSTSTSANATQETVVGKVASVISRPGAGPDGQGEVVIKLQDGMSVMINSAGVSIDGQAPMTHPLDTGNHRRKLQTRYQACMYYYYDYDYCCNYSSDPPYNPCVYYWGGYYG